MSKPVAVLISDTHYSLSSYQLADMAWRMAVDKASELGVPLIDCGDLTNDKAILRAEVMNTIINTVEYARNKDVEVTCIVGNHSLVNEKGKEHALNFLKPYATIIDSYTYMPGIARLIPYQSDLNELRTILDAIPDGSRIIMHQGVDKACGGHYVHDKSAAPAEWFKDFRVISGHYHRKQDIKCGPPRKGAVGLFSYVGTPYTTSFAEANDGPKGFQILTDDGLLEFVPTDLRKHIIIECEAPLAYGSFCRPLCDRPDQEDLVWVKIKGARSELAKISKFDIGEALGTGTDFKLDLIPTDSVKVEERAAKMTDTEVLLKLIDGLPDDQEYKNYLKDIASGVLE